MIFSNWSISHLQPYLFEPIRQQLLGEEFSSRFTSGAEVGEDEDEVSQTEQVTQDAQDEKVLALGRAGSVDNVAALVSDLSARDSEAAQWFTAMLSALEASRTEVAALQEQIYRSSQSPSRKVALESTPRSGGRYASPLSHFFRRLQWCSRLLAFAHPLMPLSPDNFRLSRRIPIQNYSNEIVSLFESRSTHMKYLRAASFQGGILT